ncbi:Dipeptide transport system permease protein DppB [Lachnospiraceae bacterium TWA4]|nr:Dipeptide transport system permease protein DppB [Lachnospiraceae bacterium TWA4]
MNYVLKKFLSFILTLFIVSFIAFFAFQLIPGDAASSLLGTSATPEKLEALREEMGLNDPAGVQYLRWLGNFVQGDFGTSYTYKTSVASIIGEKIPVTLSLAILSMIVMLIFSIPLGVLASKYAGKWLDSILQILNQIAMAVPPFFLGILMTYLFGLILNWFTPGGYISYEKDFLGFLGYLICPAIAVGLPKAGMLFKLLRSSIGKEMDKEYVRTTYSRGNTVNGAFYGHVLRNALIPVITFLAMAFADIMAGSFIVEQVFGIPGMGKILVTSISNRDYPIVQALILLTAFIILFANLLADLFYRIIDPRIGE